MNDSEAILIAGGGIGGLAAAVSLVQAGYPVAVFERSPDGVTEQGTGLNIWGNAISALDRVGLAKAVQDAGSVIETMELRAHDGSLLSENPIGEICREVGTVAVNVRRTDVQRILYEGCDDVVHLGAAAVGYRTDPEGVTLLLESGEEVRGAAVVGADGVRSAIRSQLLHDGDPRPSGNPVWRGIAEGAGPTDGTVLMVWGPRGGGAGCWHVDPAHVSWTVGTNSRFEEPSTAGAAKDALLEFVSDFAGPFQDLIRSTPAERAAASRVYIREHADRWGDGRVTLLGDAAHAMPTVLGQGACQAIEDGVVLGESVADAPDVVSGLRRYEQQRQPRVAWVREQVFKLDRFQKYESRMMSRMRNLGVRFAPASKSRQLWKDLMTFR